MTDLIRRFGRNTKGRDVAVGDIHGHFTLLRRELERIGFDPAAGDRLFSVGDLVDRGPESEDAVHWLNYPWFHPVRGNHDDYVCRYDTCDIGNWMINGGVWFAGLPTAEQAEQAVHFREMPLAIEVETDAGLIGIVHAGVPGGDWSQLAERFATRKGRNYVMWSRHRTETGDLSFVQGVAAVVVGHEPVSCHIALGNVHYIDTRGHRPADGGHFTLLDLNTLRPL